MVDKMRLEVILSAVDKATGPLKGIAKGSKATAAAIEEAQRALGKMEAEQRKIARLQDRLNSAKKGAASERDALRAAQANLEVLKTTGGATEKQIARQQASVDKQMAAYERQRNVALRLRAELNNMGVGKAAVEQAQLAARIATANAQIDAQRRKLDQQRHVEERLHALREKHGADMARMGMAEDEVVRVTSRRGSVLAPVRCDPGLRPGLLFMACNFPDDVDVNALTIEAHDPIAKTAEFKATAVRVEKTQEARPASWRAQAVADREPGRNELVTAQQEG